MSFRFRTGLLLGFGAGYMMGAKAGRERYEEIMEKVRSLNESPRVEKVSTAVRSNASQVADSATDAVTKVTERAGSAASERATKAGDSGGGTGTTSSSAPPTTTTGTGSLGASASGTNRPSGN